MKIPPFVRRADPDPNRDPTIRKKDARKLARAIEHAWEKCGGSVACSVTPVLGPTGRLLCYEIKSNLRDGLPTRRAPA